MTLFTEGRLQAYERMMRQTGKDRGRKHDSGNQEIKHGQNKNGGKQVMKGGGRHGSHQS